jgi:hypothetical protein
MFLRRNRRLVEGETYEYWTLVKTVRTARGPRQEIVATLGKEPGLESRARQGWEDVADLLEGRAPVPVQGQLGQPLPAAPPPQWAQVDLRGVRVERVRFSVQRRAAVRECLVRSTVPVGGGRSVLGH